MADINKAKDMSLWEFSVKPAPLNYPGLVMGKLIGVSLAGFLVYF